MFYRFIFVISTSLLTDGSLILTTCNKNSFPTFPDKRWMLTKKTYFFHHIKIHTQKKTYFLLRLSDNIILISMNNLRNHRTISWWTWLSWWERIVWTVRMVDWTEGSSRSFFYRLFLHEFHNMFRLLWRWMIQPILTNNLWHWIE